MFTLSPSSKDRSIRGIPTQSCSTICYIETEAKVHPACHHSDQWEIPGEMLFPSLTLLTVLLFKNFQSYFTLLRSLRVQSKKRLRQAAVNGNQEEEQGKRRKKEVKDSGLEITRMDVEEVSTFRTGMQPSPLVVCHCLNI